MEETVEHDERACAFRLPVGDSLAHLEYVMRDERTMDTTYTYTPPDARGSGISSRIVRAALDHARARNLRVIPSCWFVAGWVARHPEYEDLLA